MGALVEGRGVEEAFWVVFVEPPGHGAHRHAEVVLDEDEAGVVGLLVVLSEEDDGAGEFWEGGEGGPPLADKVSAFGVPGGEREGVGVGCARTAVGGAGGDEGVWGGEDESFVESHGRGEAGCDGGDGPGSEGDGVFLEKGDGVKVLEGCVGFFGVDDDVGVEGDAGPVGRGDLIGGGG